MNYIILWITSFLFSIAFCYYTSDKSYYITCRDRYINNCTEEQIERNRKEFIEKQGREGMTAKQRIKETIYSFIPSVLSGLSIMGISIYLGGSLLHSLVLGTYTHLMLNVHFSIMGILGLQEVRSF